MDSMKVRAPAPGRTESILIVDDDLQVLKFVGRMFAALGFHPIHQATGPQEAFQIWSEHRESIHLVVSDFVMPEITGDHLALRLLREKPELRVLFISGNDPFTLDSVVALEPGRNFLQKPFTVADLKGLLEVA